MTLPKIWNLDDIFARDAKDDLPEVLKEEITTPEEKDELPPKPKAKLPDDLPAPENAEGDEE